MTQKIVVSLFDRTGNMVAPWAKAGFLCYCVDLQHPPGEHCEGNIIRVGADIRECLPPYAEIKMLCISALHRRCSEWRSMVSDTTEMKSLDRRGRIAKSGWSKLLTGG